MILESIQLSKRKTHKSLDGRAHMVGVVSRGGECAGFNQPGIYTNLVHAKWNSWVRDAIKEGDC